MADITFDKILIAGMKYLNLINVEINKRMNTHSDAIITCEVSKEQETEMRLSVNDGNFIIISTATEENSEVLFIGVKYNVEIEENAQYYIAKMYLKSTSYLLDKEKKKRTFQNTKKTYSATMQELAGDRAIVRFNITDRPLSTFWMQINETDWNIILRLASGCNACVIANVNTKTPIIDIGVPEQVESSLQIGATSMNSLQPTFVTGTTSVFNMGVLETTCLTGYQDAFKQNRITNEETAGKMFTGIVQNVEKEKVQVFFDQIDAEYDSEGDTWFEYAAAYAGEGGTYGSGFYFMPEVGDRVRVFFPAGDSSEGFAFASESSYALDDPSQSSWRAMGGQELLFTNDGIRISGKDNSIYIDLRYDDGDVGIQISCDTDVCISTHPGEGDSLIYIKGKEEILVNADNQILLETPEAAIELDKDKIILNANQVYIE